MTIEKQRDLLKVILELAEGQLNSLEDLGYSAFSSSVGHHQIEDVRGYIKHLEDA